MTKRTNNLYSTIRKIIKAPIIENLLYILIVFIVINIFINYVRPVKEGFSEKRELVIKKNERSYDDFYANMYDNIFYNKIKNDYEIGMIYNHPGPTEKTIVLDVGSGTGHHVNALASEDIKVIGIDKSEEMVIKAKKNYPALEFHREDVLNRAAFSGSTFTHITCFNYTIYYFDNKRKFFENCYYWLKPGGCVILNLVNKNTFDPVMPAGNPFIFSGDKHVEKNGKETRIKFVGYDYKSNFEIYPNDDTAVLKERFKDVKTGNQRKQELLLYMPTQKRILNTAKNIGFVLLGQFDMSEVNAHSQFIYILQKPN